MADRTISGERTTSQWSCALEEEERWGRAVARPGRHAGEGPAEIVQPSRSASKS